MEITAKYSATNTGTDPVKGIPRWEDLAELARQIRVNALRMTNAGGSSHIGSILSMADLLAVLYGKVLKVSPLEPKAEKRDRFILSKGHAGAGVYAALALTGFFPIDRLVEHCANGSIFSGHVSHKGVPGVELSTGSLGHGLSVGAGMAYGAKLDGLDYKTFVLLSDGELDEGSNWEAILFASHFKLDNLVAIVDFNKIQSLGPVAATLNLEPLADKWRAFGWHVREVDGHNLGQIEVALTSVPEPGMPTVVLAHTIKGKGVSFMEHSVAWHYRTAKGDDFSRALAELGESA
jgi:transketolase